MIWEEFGPGGANKILLCRSTTNKVTFCPIFGKFITCDTQNIILCEMEFNPHGVRLNIRKTQFWNFMCFFKFFWVFRCLVKSDLSWVEPMRSQIDAEWDLGESPKWNSSFLDFIQFWPACWSRSTLLGHCIGFACDWHTTPVSWSYTLCIKVKLHLLASLGDICRSMLWIKHKWTPILFCNILLHNIDLQSKFIEIVESG